MSARNGLLSIDRKPSPLKRWLSGDNRMTTLMYVTNVVNEALLSKCDQELEDAIPGIESLKVTYADDAVIVAGIDVILMRIRKKKEGARQQQLASLD